MADGNSNLEAEQAVMRRVDTIHAGSPDHVRSLYFRITPTPGFVAKIKVTTDHIGYIFINICEHDAIPQSDRHVIVEHWPVVAIGNIRKTLDHEGRRCTAVDAVVHPGVLVDILTDRTNSNRDQVAFSLLFVLFFQKFNCFFIIFMLYTIY